jgi:hypothetical protein
MKIIEYLKTTIIKYILSIILNFKLEKMQFLEFHNSLSRNMKYKMLFFDGK